MPGREFEWDPGKAQSNLRKHRIAFADAVTLFDDPWALTIRDPDAAGEERFISQGRDAFGRILVMVFTMRGEVARVISARAASPGETRRYLETR